MQLNYTNLPDWLQWLIGLTILAAAVLGLVGFARKTWPILSRFVSTVNALADLPKALEEQSTFRDEVTASLAAQDKKIAEIHHETHENNGSSIKDSNRRIEAQGKSNAARLARVEKGVKGLYTREEIDAKTTALSDELERTRPPVRRRTTKPKETS